MKGAYFMKLFIAEKPDIAEAIAAYIWPQNDFKKESGYFYKEDTRQPTLYSATIYG